MPADGPPREAAPDSAAAPQDRQLGLFDVPAGEAASGPPASGEADPARAALGERAGIHVSCGARATQQAILQRVAHFRARAAADPARLARGVRVVVPSRGLRDQLAAEAVRAHGGLAGVRVQTSFELAFEVASGSAAGRRVLAGLAGGRRLLPLLVRRHARRHEGLQRVLEPLVDGFGVALASVRDLLDAGLEPALVEGLVEAARELGAGGERAVALLRVAGAVLEDLDALGLAAPPALFQVAADALRAGHDLAARAVWIHGFADATGVQAELLHALVHHCDAELHVDHPEDPAGDGVAPGPVFTARLREHLTAPEHAAPEPAPPAGPAPLLVQAPGAEAEVRAVARALRERLDAGAPPQGLGVVARDLAPYRAAIAGHFERLAIPYSGSLAAQGPAARRCSAWLELVERGGVCSLDRWLEAGGVEGSDADAALRLALHGIGVGRLRDLVEIDLERVLGGRRDYPLRSLRRLARPAEDDDGSSDEEAEADAAAGPRGRRAAARGRHVSRAALLGAQRRARDTLDAIEVASAPGTLAGCLARLRRLTHRVLRLAPGQPGVGEIDAALAALEGSLPADLALEAGEIAALLRRELAEAGRSRLGGQGGGVQVLTVTEARGFCFDALFVLGLNRDVFPRVAREDPLLGDDVRLPLLALLPDLPIKSRAADEERYLFAQLCSAAPQVVISWQALGDDGRERVCSPLVERLRLGRGLPVETAPAVLDEQDVLRPAHEHAVCAGVRRQRAVHRAALAAMDARRGDAGTHAPASNGGDAQAVAAARMALLVELDPPPGAPERERPGAFGGLVGAHSVRVAAERPLYVTRLEAAFRCPWQAFLERELGLEPVPDALAELPGASALLIGNVVHAVLEEIVQAAGAPVGISLAEACRAAPVPVAWPDADALDATLRMAAAEVARQQGIVLPGFAAYLARRARPCIETVRALEWGHGPLPSVVGAELYAELDLDALGLPGRRIGFAADRADRMGEGGALSLVDYKTGQPISKLKREARRREALLRQIAGRERLQAAVYALAEPGARGHYLFVRPDLDPEHARVTVRAEDDEAREALAGALAEGLAAWEAGIFPPRLRASSGQPNPACARCAVAEACVVGDSVQQQRQQRWLEAATGARGAASDDEARALRLLGAGT